MLLEVCVDNFESAILAEAGGAGRIELCSSLMEGGLTPSTGFLKNVKSHLKIPIFVMIRPRGGDFVYSEGEVQIMMDDIKILKEFGADGFVFGILTKDAEVNKQDCLKLLAEANPLPCTFHRAFDLVGDPMKSLDEISNLGFRRILTSGQEKTAIEGMDLIKLLASKNRLSIMAGSGINPINVKSILDTATNVTEIHASCRKPIESKMNLRKTKYVKMGSNSDEMTIHITDPEAVTAIVQHFNK